MLGFQEFGPETMLPPGPATQTGKSVGSVGAGTGPILRFVIRQLSVAGLPAGASGAIMSLVTGTVAEEVHPVKLLVMTRV